jgi:hypothetical protein
VLTTPNPLPRPTSPTAPTPSAKPSGPTSSTDPGPTNPPAVLAAITHNLLRAAGTLTDTARYTVARGATLRTHLINTAARFARPQRRPTLHLPTHWPRADAWLTLWRAVFDT